MLVILHINWDFVSKGKSFTCEQFWGAMVTFTSGTHHFDCSLNHAQSINYPLGYNNTLHWDVDC